MITTGLFIIKSCNERHKLSKLSHLKLNEISQFNVYGFSFVTFGHYNP